MGLVYNEQQRTRRALRSLVMLAGSIVQQAFPVEYVQWVRGLGN